MTLTQNNYRGGPISNLLILCAADLNHGLGSRVLDLDLNATKKRELLTQNLHFVFTKLWSGIHIHLSQNSIAIIGHDDTTHGIQKHLRTKKQIISSNIALEQYHKIHLAINNASKYKCGLNTRNTPSS